MASRYLKALTVGAAILALGACNKAGNTSGKPAAADNSVATIGTGAASNDPIQSAESAAPTSIAHNASIVTMDASGNAKTLRQGTNGWT